ncbi:MAG: acyl carrier protein [Bacillota bacterium]
MFVLDKIKGIIAEELGVEEDTINADSMLADDLGADSLDAVELIMAIEEEFDVEIDDSAATKIKTVQDIADYLEKHSK